MFLEFHFLADQNSDFIWSRVFAMARFPSIVSSSRRQTAAFFCISIAALVKFAMRKIEFVVSLEFLQNVEKQSFGCSSRIFWINCSHEDIIIIPSSHIFFVLGCWMLFNSFFLVNCCLLGVDERYYTLAIWFDSFILDAIEQATTLWKKVSSVNCLKAVDLSIDRFFVLKRAEMQFIQMPIETGPSNNATFWRWY